MPLRGVLAGCLGQNYHPWPLSVHLPRASHLAGTCSVGVHHAVYPQGLRDPQERPCQPVQHRARTLLWQMCRHHRWGPSSQGTTSAQGEAIPQKVTQLPGNGAVLHTPGWGSPHPGPGGLLPVAFLSWRIMHAAQVQISEQRLVELTLGAWSQALIGQCSDSVSPLL